MSVRNLKTPASWLFPALAIASTTLLSACQMDEAGDFTDPARTAYYERYPIKVTTAPVKMGIGVASGELQPDQANAVANFARDARNDARSRIVIRWPSGSGAKGRQAASDAAAVMVAQGIPSDMISVGSYSAGAHAPLQLSYERKVAVTRECGDWSENLAYSPRNDDYPNFGCAYQHNIAAMVANAEDFEHPRAESKIVAASRVAAMKIYFGSATDVSSSSTTQTENKDKSKTENAGGTSGN